MVQFINYSGSIRLSYFFGGDGYYNMYIYIYVYNDNSNHNNNNNNIKNVNLLVLNAGNFREWSIITSNNNPSNP